jgi:hypothetical protein
MGMELADYGPKPTTSDADLQRQASVRVADQVTKQHPHPFDDDMPKLAGRLIARDPIAAAGVLELLAALGLPTVPSLEQIGKRIGFAACFYLAVYRARITDLEHAVRAVSSFTDSDRNAQEAS